MVEKRPLSSEAGFLPNRRLRTSFPRPNQESDILVTIDPLTNEITCACHHAPYGVHVLMAARYRGWVFRI